MAVRDFAVGLPDAARFGRVTDLPLNKLLTYVRQLHEARRAGKHFDLRIGQDDKTRKAKLLSWALRHWPGKPGEKRQAFRQPLHRGSYANFEGEIPSGYGAGTVTTDEKGSVLVTKVTPGKINFSIVGPGKQPKPFALIRQSGPPTNPKTTRERQTQGGTWLLANVGRKAKLPEDNPAVLKAAALRMLLWPSVKSATIRTPKRGREMLDGPLTAVIRQTTEELGGAGSTLADFAKVAGIPQVDVPEISPELQQALEQARSGPSTVGDRLRGLLLGMRPQQVGHLRSGLSGFSKAVETVKALSAKLKGEQEPPSSVRTPPPAPVA